MNTEMMPMEFQEQVMYTLRSLYSRFGYTQYKMSKFEEYDLYARNKDFLISDHVITFTDLDGKLMALKPDVTLSIVKNTKDLQTAVQKLYYTENVYRVAKGSKSFREIMQIGLECLGNIDDYCISEVLYLAAESLRSISQDSILEVSHVGLLQQVLEALCIPREMKDDVLKYIGEKNIHELTQSCLNCGVSENNITILAKLIKICGAPEQALPQVEQLLADLGCAKPLAQLKRVIEGCQVKDMLQLDFSLVDDAHYYNGIVFKGFIAGLPGSVLSGGQYDKLMRKMNRKAGAMGFAVYTDMLERLNDGKEKFDVDAVLLYDEETKLDMIRTQMDRLTGRGLRVLAQQSKPEGIRYGQLIKMNGNEVEMLENNA